jgi:hypothetical protein
MVFSTQGLGIQSSIPSVIFGAAVKFTGDFEFSAFLRYFFAILELCGLFDEAKQFIVAL